MTSAHLHEFTAFVHSDRGDGDDVLSELFTAGVDDALVQADSTRFEIAFDREAATPRDAIQLATEQIESVDGLRVIRVEPRATEGRRDS